MNADEKKLIRIAKRNGATVETRNSHYRIHDADGNFVVKLAVGTAKHHDTKEMVREWKRRGWL